MPYDITNPPALLSCGIGGRHRKWRYETDQDAVADIDTDGYITNAQELGMRVNDVVDVIDSTGAVTTHRVASIDADTGAGNFGDGTVVGSVADAD